MNRPRADRLAGASIREVMEWRAKSMRTERAGPFVIVEGPEDALEHAVREQEASGRVAVPGFHQTRDPRPMVRTGIVADTRDAEAALLAALRSEGLVVHATAPRQVVDRLVDDLRRLGPVDHRIGAPQQPPAITSDARAILGLLAEGHSLGEAAGILGLSRRTADRRLAKGRQALGAERTTEAISMARHLGWLGRDRSRLQ